MSQDSRPRTKTKNPQFAVIESFLEDLRRRDEDIGIILGASEDEEILEAFDDKKGRKKRLEKLKLKVANLRGRHKALVRVLIKDNYYRNLNRELLEILHELPGFAHSSIEFGDIEIAQELAYTWEGLMHRIFRECYPNAREERKELLDSVARMKIMPMPGGFGSPMRYGEGDDSESSWGNVGK